MAGGAARPGWLGVDTVFISRLFQPEFNEILLCYFFFFKHFCEIVKTFLALLGFNSNHSRNSIGNNPVDNNIQMVLFQ